MNISYKNLKRYREIVQVLIKYGFSYVVEKLNLSSIGSKIPITNPNEDIKNMSVGERLRRGMEELGPTYVKIGQILSTRRDLLDQDIIEELSKLRDSVEPFDTYIAREIFAKEVGSTIDEIFLEFNNNPIAAASIGQVYEAKLKSGEEVIVKIQRPNIEDLIKSDIEIMNTIANALKETNREINIDLNQIVGELKNQLLRELDYKFEAINAYKFKKIFENDKEVYIPTVHKEYTTKKVLVMEKIVGIKLSDVEKIKKKGWSVDAISEIGTKALLKQIFEHGFFHADLHPGNIFVLNSHKIAYIDFGMIGILDRKTLELLNQIAIAAIEKNVDKIIHILIEIEALDSDVNIYGLRQDLLYLIHYYYDLPIDEIDISNIINDVFRFFRTYNVNIPSQLSMLGKAVITVEGTGRELNPKFSVAKAGTEFMRYYYAHKFNPKNILLNSKQDIEEALLDIKALPKQLKSILRNIQKNDVKISIDDIKVTSLEKCIADIGTQVSLSLVLASIVVGSSLIISSPNINSNIWIKFMALAGFFTSFIIGLLLVIKILRSQYRKR